MTACLCCEVFLHTGSKFQEVCVYFKELERNLELSANSFQRQLAAERRKTLSAQEEIQGLQEELQRVASRLKVSAPKKC